MLLRLRIGGGGMSAVEIITSFDAPPIASRNFDWTAVTASYEPGDPVGRGATEKEAYKDLTEQLEGVDE